MSVSDWPNNSPTNLRCLAARYPLLVVSNILCPFHEGSSEASKREPGRIPTEMSVADCDCSVQVLYRGREQIIEEW
jgi:hypothetical protein